MTLHRRHNREHTDRPCALCAELDAIECTLIGRFGSMLIRLGLWLGGGLTRRSLFDGIWKVKR